MEAERILIVDDDQAVVDLCQQSLGDEYHLSRVTSGQAALQRLEKEPFDLVLVDLDITDTDGLEVLRRACEASPPCSVIAMTEQGTLEKVLDSLRAGAHSFLLKPFGPDELALTVREALADHRSHEAGRRLDSLLPILEISHPLATEADIGLLGGRLLRAVASQLRASRASLLLLDGKNGDMYVVSSLGMPKGFSELRLTVHDDFPIHDAPVIVEGGNHPHPTLREMTEWAEQINEVYMPLRVRDETIGILHLGRPADEKPFTASELSLLSIIAAQMATALDNARLYAEVSKARREWEATFDAIADGIAILDPEFTIVRANRALADLLDIPLEELIGAKCYKVIHGLDEPPAGCPHLIAMRLKSPHGTEMDMPQLGRTFEISAHPIMGDDGKVTGMVHSMHDVTEWKRVQEHLVRTEKLAALGRLAASLAHEINNPLQALSSGLRLIGHPGLDDDRRRQYIKIAAREVQRLIDLVERMRGFYRPSTGTPKPSDVNDLLREVLALAGKELEHNGITVQCNLAPRLPTVRVIADQLKQVFLNIILNAMQAMPDGGTLTISTGVMPGEAAVYIRFTDTGHGIAAEHMKHIFEPFYTTKPNGSGLGLSVSYNIVRQHGGRIEVESTLGRGAIFTVVLPIAGQEEE